jgi:hypothetical protein
MTHAQASCQVEASSRAKYGTPKRPWMTFGRFYTGSSYIKSGVAILMENDAQFQNGFGAMVHSTVACSYDLNQKKALSATITSN